MIDIVSSIASLDNCFLCVKQIDGGNPGVREAQMNQTAHKKDKKELKVASSDFV